MSPRSYIVYVILITKDLRGHTHSTDRLNFRRAFTDECYKIYKIYTFEFDDH